MAYAHEEDIINCLRLIHRAGVQRFLHQTGARKSCVRLFLDSGGDNVVDTFLQRWNLT